jgi:hypothetical protein
MPEPGKPKDVAGRSPAIPPATAAWCGLALLVLTAVACLVLFWASVSGGRPPNQPVQPLIGLGVLCGVVLLLTSIAGLVLLYQALGLAQPSAAFGMPDGSVRALLALGLVVVFVSVASWAVFDEHFSEGTKQILAISGTSLSTVIGFYFGAKSSADVARLAGQIRAPGRDGTTGPTPPSQPPDPAELARKVRAIRSLAEATKAKQAGITDPSIDTLEAQIAAQSGASPLDTPDLTRARMAFQRMTTTAAACATDADRAEAALKDIEAAPGDLAKLAPPAARIEQLGADAATSNHDFETAFEDFKAARDALLRRIAKG